MEIKKSISNIIIAVIVFGCIGFGTWWYFRQQQVLAPFSDAESSRIRAELQANTLPLTESEIQQVQASLQQEGTVLSQEDVARIRTELGQ